MSLFVGYRQAYRQIAQEETFAPSPFKPNYNLAPLHTTGDSRKLHLEPEPSQSM